MKKHQSKGEPLYATVNKPHRTHHTPPTPETEEVTYADVSTTGRGRGQSPHHHPEEPVYAEVSTTGRGRRQSPHHPEEPVYADVSTTGDRRQHPHHHPGETVYAEVSTTGGRGQHPHHPSQAAQAEAAGAGRAPTPPRSAKDEITRNLLQSTDFQYGVAEVQYWCNIVYGNRHAYNEQLSQVLDNPKAGKQILWKLAADPESGGKLAGRQMVGIKSPDRKKAEEGFGPLCAAFERHVDTTQKLYKDFAQQQEKQHSQERDRSPESKVHRHHHHHHHHHRGGEREQRSQQQQEQQRRSPSPKGMAHAM
ncbi:BID domain-containing T4SS effector [Candidatus Bartonella washoeensis]|uniref:Uncharacterized protein n=1 Tax=Cardidatus Bartonella washoeensis 085-0475 TaxID=1094564 RepID=J1JPU2_9HYPH|nr:BID domain-containing T4SS effector [Bartonella washoeensis]EJF86807.1 hypothetical protein MCW_00030 [Bartonella washoeensis 085-0475]